jgi:hypothetical protein
MNYRLRLDCPVKTHEAGDCDQVRGSVIWIDLEPFPGTA